MPAAKRMQVNLTRLSHPTQHMVSFLKISAALNAEEDLLCQGAESKSALDDAPRISGFVTADALSLRCGRRCCRCSGLVHRHIPQQRHREQRVVDDVDGCVTYEGVVAKPCRCACAGYALQHDRKGIIIIQKGLIPKNSHLKLQ